MAPLKNTIFHGSATDAYDKWGTPQVIISDGAYGIGGFPGDPKKPNLLPGWYEEHVAAWSSAAAPETTLWFWNTEVGWAFTHPLLEANGWKYIQLVTWDKGIGHVAGNVNGDTIRRLPTVTEVAALYVRAPVFISQDSEELTAQQWLRDEWKRAGLTLNQANEACGVRNAASRKYLTGDHNWYMPPPEAFEQLRAYANTHGDPAGTPYLTNLPNNQPASWLQRRGTWNHQHGLTNVWSHRALRSEERLRDAGTGKFLHTNQKPLELMRRQIELVSNPGDVVWEPFGGTCSASVAAKQLRRSSFAAEPVQSYHAAAVKRLKNTAVL